MEIKDEDLKRVYELLHEVKYPTIQFVDDFTTCRIEAMKKMRDSADMAAEILEKYNVEEL